MFSSTHNKHTIKLSFNIAGITQFDCKRRDRMSIFPKITHADSTDISNFRFEGIAIFNILPFKQIFLRISSSLILVRYFQDTSHLSHFCISFLCSCVNLFRMKHITYSKLISIPQHSLMIPISDKGMIRECIKAYMVRVYVRIIILHIESRKKTKAK